MPFKILNQGFSDFFRWRSSKRNLTLPKCYHNLERVADSWDELCVTNNSAY